MSDQSAAARRRPSRTLARAGGALGVAALVAGGVGVAVASPAHPAAAAKESTHRTIATVKAHSLGRVLATSNGRVLYLFERDGRDKSHCDSSCRAVWPRVTSKGAPRAGAHVSGSRLGRTRAGQVTYHGHPLYMYVGDHGARQHHGEGLEEFGGSWYAVNIHGKAVDDDSDDY